VQPTQEEKSRICDSLNHGKKRVHYYGDEKSSLRNLTSLELFGSERVSVSSDREPMTGGTAILLDGGGEVWGTEKGAGLDAKVRRGGKKLKVHEETHTKKILGPDRKKRSLV